MNKMKTPTYILPLNILQPVVTLIN